MDETLYALHQWRQQAQVEAVAAQITPGEVDLLLEDGLGWKKLDRLLGRPPQDPIDWERLQSLWQLRLQRIPLQYLLGQANWRDVQLQVTPDVLIPRPETELLVDIAVSWLGSQPSRGLWVDLGTGSGAIAIGLAREIPSISVVAVDLSSAALAVAASNVERLGVGNRVQLRQGNWFEPLDPWRGQIQGMVANPPYIPTEWVKQLQPEVRLHEPHLALDGGETGLDALAHLIEQAPFYLHPGGLWLVEVMQGQANWVAEQLQLKGDYTKVTLYSDLAGIERIVSAQLNI